MSIKQELIITFTAEVDGGLNVEYKLDPPQQLIPTIDCTARSLGLLALAATDQVYTFMKRNIRESSPIITGV